MGELPKNLSQLHIEKAIDQAAGRGIQPPRQCCKKTTSDSEMAAPLPRCA
jgi:hypothetical protein